jgi:hypothetical protein
MFSFLRQFWHHIIRALECDQCKNETEEEYRDRQW